MNGPKFSKEFKEAAVRRIEEGTSVNAGARAGKIEPAAVQEWCGESDDSRTEALLRNGKRKFTKEFKEAAVRRVEDGIPLKEVARAYRLHPSRLRRWRDALRELGPTAFFDSVPKPKAVLFRVTEDEHNRLKAIAKAAGAPSLSELARRRLLIEPGPLVGASRSRRQAVNVIFRLTEGEHFRLEAMAKMAGVRSLSELLRSRLLLDTGQPTVGSASRSNTKAVNLSVTEDEHIRLKAIAKASGARSLTELVRRRLLFEARQPLAGATSRNRTRAMNMSVTEDEHIRLKAIARAAGASNLSEFARDRLLSENS